MGFIAVRDSQLNVRKNCPWLFGRCTYLRDKFKEKAVAIQIRSLYAVEETEIPLESGRKVKSFTVNYSDSEEAKWIGVAQ
jgi:hypothetical protein